MRRFLHRMAATSSVLVVPHLFIASQPTATTASEEQATTTAHTGSGQPSNDVPRLPRTRLHVVHPEIVGEWVAEMNDVDPTTVTSASLQIAFWRCKACGSVFEMAVRRRVQLGSHACPHCSSPTALKGGEPAAATGEGETSASPAAFSAAFPDLVKYWDCQRNHDREVQPDRIPCDSDRVVWWRYPHGEKIYSFQRPVNAFAADPYPREVKLEARAALEASLLSDVLSAAGLPPPSDPAPLPCGEGLQQILAEWAKNVTDVKGEAAALRALRGGRPLSFADLASAGSASRRHLMFTGARPIERIGSDTYAVSVTPSLLRQLQLRQLEASLPYGVLLHPTPQSSRLQDDTTAAVPAAPSLPQASPASFSSTAELWVGEPVSGSSEETLGSLSFARVPFPLPPSHVKEPALARRVGTAEATSTQHRADPKDTSAPSTAEATSTQHRADPKATPSPASSPRRTSTSRVTANGRAQGGGEQQQAAPSQKATAATPATTAPATGRSSTSSSPAAPVSAPAAPSAPHRTASVTSSRDRADEVEEPTSLEDSGIGSGSAPQYPQAPVQLNFRIQLPRGDPSGARRAAAQRIKEPAGVTVAPRTPRKVKRVKSS